MPIQGKDGKYRPLGYTGEPMNKREYDKYMNRKAPKGPSGKKRKLPITDARLRQLSRMGGSSKIKKK